MLRKNAENLFVHKNGDNSASIKINMLTYFELGLMDEQHPMRFYRLDLKFEKK